MARGGGTTNTTILETTWDPNQTTITTTYSDTTWDPDNTTIPNTTVDTTLPFDPYVLVCVADPGNFNPTYSSFNSATPVNLSPPPPNPQINPYQSLDFGLNFGGLSNGDYSFTTFDLVISASVTAGIPNPTLGQGIEATQVDQTVSFDSNNNVIYSSLDFEIKSGVADGRTLKVTLGINEGKTHLTGGTWLDGQKNLDFGRGVENADVWSADILKPGIGWEFAVMRLSEALEYQNSLNAK